MLTKQVIREKEANKKWQKLTQVLEQRIAEVSETDGNKTFQSLYENILIDIKRIEHIENTLASHHEDLKLAPEIQKKLVLERDEIRIEASFKFLAHLVNQIAISLEQRVENFLIGVSCINAVLLHSGDTLFSLKIHELERFIANCYVYIDVWKSLENQIENDHLFLLHENSLKLIYASLYVLEHTYSHLQRETQVENSSDTKIEWEQEIKNRDSLLEAIEEWTEEEWTEEEQQAYERAMANL